MRLRIRLCRPRSERGSASLELAIVGPGIILLTLLIVQTALWFHARQVAQAAVEQGARATRAYQGTEAEGRQVTSRYFNVLDGPKVTRGAPSVTASRDGTTATVRLETSAVRVTPFLPAWPVKVVAGGPVEQFQPPGGVP